MSTRTATSVGRTSRAYRPILKRLLRLCGNLGQALFDHPLDDVPKRLILAFLTKATDTLRAIILLYENDLPHEAQSLIRIVFELQVTVDAFVRLLRENPHRACERVIDSIMLEKVKQQRQSGFKGLDMVPSAPTANDLQTLEHEIATRYSDVELKSIRKHGFSGMSVEDRARLAGHGDIYQIVYRNFSRNVHSGDFAELLRRAGGVNLPTQHSDYLDERDGVGCEVAFVSVANIAGTCNAVFQLGFEVPLDKLNADRERLRDGRR